MRYTIQILRRAQKALAHLPNQDYERMRDAIHDLAENPRPHGCKKLISREGWRIRIGSYRIIYEIKDELLIITVLDIGHRREIYK